MVIAPKNPKMLVSVTKVDMIGEIAASGLAWAAWDLVVAAKTPEMLVSVVFR